MNTLSSDEKLKTKAVELCKWIIQNSYNPPVGIRLEDSTPLLPSGAENDRGGRRAASMIQATLGGKLVIASPTQGNGPDSEFVLLGSQGRFLVDFAAWRREPQNHRLYTGDFYVYDSQDAEEARLVESIYGDPSVWLVEPERPLTVEVYHLNPDRRAGNIIAFSPAAYTKIATVETGNLREAARLTTEKTCNRAQVSRTDLDFFKVTLTEPTRVRRAFRDDDILVKGGIAYLRAGDQDIEIPAAKVVQMQTVGRSFEQSKREAQRHQSGQALLPVGDRARAEQALAVLRVEAEQSAARVRAAEEQFNRDYVLPENTEGKSEANTL